MASGGAFTIENPLKIDAEKMESAVQALAKHSLLAAAHAGKAELVAQHIAKGADLEARDGRGRRR